MESAMISVNSLVIKGLWWLNFFICLLIIYFNRSISDSDFEFLGAATFTLLLPNL